jgi:hypothetical protein
MPRMLDLIRSSQMPSNLMQFAARGALAVPPEETIEILVHIALHNRIFGEQSRFTLAGWDEKASKAAAADPKTSAEVLKYFISPENLRIVLLPELAENPSVEEDSLDQLAASGSRSIVEALLMSRRVMNSRRLLEALQSNPHLRPNELADIGKKIRGEEPNPVVESKYQEEAVEESHETDAPDAILEETVTSYLQENATELEAERDKPFQPIGLGHEEAAILTESRSFSPDTGETPVAQHAVSDAMLEVGTVAAVVAADEEIAAGTVGKPTESVAVKPTGAGIKPKKPMVPPLADRRDSTLQKISKLDIRGRISLAMRGNKEDRTILIRDSTKLVAVAVLESPKITDGEVEAFALQKNVLESVLRAIPMKRRFAKNYNIMRNLVQNPRTPLDLSLTLMKNLLARDLKNLSGNKEVADTIRKVALRMYKQKMEKKD